MITLTYLLKMCDNTVQKAVKAHWNSPLQHMSIKMILAFPAVYVTQLLGSWNFTSQSRFIFKSVEISRDQSELETLIDIVGFFGRGRRGLFNLLSDAIDCLASIFLWGLSSNSGVFLKQNIMYEFGNRMPLTHNYPQSQLMKKGVC